MPFHKINNHQSKSRNTSLKKYRLVTKLSREFGLVKAILMRGFKIRTSDYKYFRDKNDKEKLNHLFNLQLDPLEENNIVDKNPEIVEKMEEMISEIHTNSKKSSEEYDDDELAEIEKELKKLGYN